MKIENLEFKPFSELCMKIAQRIKQKNVFCEADIAADGPLEMKEDETLEDIYHDSCAWFGIKQIDSPFDSSDRLFMVDMYGGGAASVVQVYADMDVNDLFADIRYAFRNCINSCGYSIDDDENILLEWV